MPAVEPLEFRTSRNTRYHLLANRPATGQPAWFFFHGFLGQAEDWFPLIHHLPAHTPWYAVDMLGHGQSERPRQPGSYQPESLYRDVAEILNHFRHSNQDVAVGYSMGGRQLLGACIQEPYRPGALILMGAHFGLQSDTERAVRQQVDQHWAEQIRQSLPSFLTAWYQQPLLSRQPPKDPQQYAQWYQRRLDNEPETLALCLTEFSPARTPDFSTPFPSALDFPVLLMSGEYDTRYVAHYKEIVESLPHACHIVLPDCGHTLPIEAPEATSKSCLKFLNSLPL